jgi:hypothetical protein
VFDIQHSIFGHSLCNIIEAMNSCLIDDDLAELSMNNSSAFIMNQNGVHMAVEWENVIKSGGKLFLLFLEYCVKVTAVVVTAVTLSARGAFGEKLGTGFSSLSPSLRKLFDSPSEISGAASMIHEYHTLSAAAFHEQYGAEAINGVLAYLNGGIVYLQSVAQNFASQPFSTFFAALVAFGSLYLLSFILRFARQKGQGSYLTQLERRLAAHIFDEFKISAQSDQKSTPENKSKPKKQAKQPIASPQRTNEYLQDYMRSAKSG